MLAAHDQENLVFSRQTVAAAKQQQQQQLQGIRQLQPKTPGARYPKTPLKVPLNDENATNLMGGKTVLGQKTKGNENIQLASKAANKSSLATPLEPRTARAPLGNKTTNAKSRTGQPLGVKDIVREFEKSQAKPTTIKRIKQQAPQVESTKLEVHNDNSRPLGEEEDIEYAPPRLKETPYESDVFPAGVLTFEGVKPENLFKGYYNFYYNPVDDDGVPLKEKEMEERKLKAWKEAEEKMTNDMNEMDWSIGDVPASKDFFKKKRMQQQSLSETSTAPPKPMRIGTKPPPTIAARKAASVLSMAPKPSPALQPNQSVSTSTTAKTFLPLKKVLRPVPVRNSSTERATAVAASRSTLGYAKGRSASSMVHGRTASQGNSRCFTHSASSTSTGSDATITPAGYAQSQAAKNNTDEDLRRLEFLSIFDPDEEDDGNLGGTGGLFAGNDSEDDFQLKLDFA